MNLRACIKYGAAATSSPLRFSLPDEQILRSCHWAGKTKKTPLSVFG